MSPVVSNTSPVTNLAIIGRLSLVRDQLAPVAVPDAVWREILALPHDAGRSALLAAARKAGSLPSTKPEIERLRIEAGFFVSDEVVAATLRLSGEA